MSSKDAIREEEFVAAGLRWRVATAGPKEGPPVMLLHGFPEYWGTWLPQIPALASEGFRVYVPDLPGYGGTEAPGSYAIDDVARALADLRIQLAQEGLHVVGHDWGGIIAQALASQHPEAVLSLVAACAPHPGALSGVLRDPAQMLRSWYVMAFQVPFVERALGHKDLIERLARGAVTEIDDAAAMARALAYYRTNLRPWRLSRPRGGRISQPGLVIHAARDPAIGEPLMRATADRFDDLRAFRIIDGGHFLQRFRTDELNAELLGFLREVA